MKNFMLSALVALFAIGAGALYAQSDQSTLAVSQTTGSVDQATMERIYEAVCCETGKSLGEVREMDAHGELVVEQTGDDQYRVVLEDGGILDILMGEDF